MATLVTSVTSEAIAPHRLKMSYEDYLNYADETKIVEWVNGEGIIYMPPTDRHQAVSAFLYELLSAFIHFFNLGDLRYAPLEVKLWPDGPAREPDIFFVRRENRARLTEKRFAGGPDLIIEIISPSSVTEDRVHKFNEYEQAGVNEYWLIDPRPHQQQADFYILGEDNHYQPALIDKNGVYHSTVVPNFWLSLNWLWLEELPKPQLLFTEIMLSVEGLSAEAKTTFQALRQLLASKAAGD